MHVIEWGKPIKHGNKLVNEKMRKSLMLGLNKARFIFAWINSINSINSIIWRYKIKFIPILKNFKNQGKCEIACRRKWQQILLKIGLLRDKNSEEKMKSWNYLRIENLKIIWKLEFGKLFLKSKMKKWERGHVVQRWPCKPCSSGILSLGRLEHWLHAVSETPWSRNDGDYKVLSVPKLEMGKNWS